MEISEATQRGRFRADPREVVRHLNEVMIGWADYFCLGPVSKAYTVVDRHARYRLRQWLCGKHHRSGQGWTRYSDEYLDHTLGLTRLQVRTRDLPWANA